jgi:glycopeptide antibiotics resistance protein
MSRFFNKVVMILPVVVLGAIYLRAHTSDYRHVSGQRLFLLMVSVGLLYGWILLEVLFEKQKSVFLVTARSSFYVYIFMVLTLTGYFILFREVSVHDWWHHMLKRVERRQRVNLQLFEMFRIYKISSKQIIGNFIMLLPLGIYLPVLYRRMKHFLPVMFVCFFISMTIELLQLVTSFRSADVDDILLNTLGACCGFILYKLFYELIKPTPPAATFSPVS